MGMTIGIDVHEEKFHSACEREDAIKIMDKQEVIAALSVAKVWRHG
jgi:ATP sulfurylase